MLLSNKVQVWCLVSTAYVGSWVVLGQMHEDVWFCEFSEAKTYFLNIRITDLLLEVIMLLAVHVYHTWRIDSLSFFCKTPFVLLGVMKRSPMIKCWFLTRELRLSLSDSFSMWLAFSMSTSWIDSKLSDGSWYWADGVIVWAVCVGFDVGRQAVIAWLAVDDGRGCETSAQNSSSGYRSVRVKFTVSWRDPCIGGTLAGENTVEQGTRGGEPGEVRDFARCELCQGQILLTLSATYY